MQPTIWGINVSWIYTWVLDISGRHLGAACIVGVSVRPLGAVLGNINLLKYIFVLNICCQQFGEYMSVEYICWYWIYHANNLGEYILVDYICWYWICHANSWGMNVSWTVSVRPSGAGMENRHFDVLIWNQTVWDISHLEAFVGIGYIMPTIRENISWWIICLDNGYIMPTFEGIIVDWRVFIFPFAHRVWSCTL